jgi:SOS-response transcriptional repressor LexA
VLAWIEEHIRERCYAPTIRDITHHFGWGSTRAAMDHLAALEAKGAIRRVRGIARGIVIVLPDPEETQPPVPVPVSAVESR